MTKIFHSCHGFIRVLHVLLLLSCKFIFVVVCAEGHSIRLLTWNLLAPIYATPAKYPLSTAAAAAAITTNHLDWKTVRQPKIIHALLQSQADLICLQEVQLDLWEDFWHEFCSAAAATAATTDDNEDEAPTYTAVVQNVTRQHPVACAVLIKQSSFRVLRVESRSRACLVVLEEEEEERTVTIPDNRQQLPQSENDASSNSIFNKHLLASNQRRILSSLSLSSSRPMTKKKKKKRLYLATVHLEAGFEKQDTRWNQIKSLLKRCYRHMELDVAAEDDDDKVDEYNENYDKDSEIAQQPLILAGDFNMWTRQCPLYHTLAGMKTDNYLGILHQYKNNNNEKKTTYTWQTLLPLQNVHQHDRPPLTYAGGSVLDYCWVRNLSEYKPYWPTLQKQQPLELVEFPDHTTEDELMPAQAWPSQHVPSDHLPIGVEFCL